MKMIQFKSLQNDGTIKIVGTAKMVEGKVELVITQKGGKRTLDSPVYNTKLKKEVTKSDGLPWLEALPYNYAGSRFFAEEVEVK
jgi:hypothetical protein